MSFRPRAAVFRKNQYKVVYSPTSSTDRGHRAVDKVLGHDIHSTLTTMYG